MTDRTIEIEVRPGLSRYVDDTTALLNVYAASFEDAQQGYIRANNRGDTYSAEELKKHSDRLARRLRKTLETHVLWPWLEPLKGLAGPRVARVIAAIGDPRRFPGQKCSEGHVLPPVFVEGVECPVPAVTPAEIGLVFGGDELSPDSGEGPLASGFGTANCPGILLPPRTTTGVRSLWHYAGLHVVDGKLPQRRKGQQADWKPQLRTLLIGPQGVGDMIVMHRTPGYRDTYDTVKARKGELAPWRADKIAKTVAVKEFVGDMLTEWKARAATIPVSEVSFGASPPQVAA